MSAITASAVKELREKTSVGMMDCKKALTEADGDMDKAVDLLRQKGLATALKRSGKTASEGVIGSYIHMNKIGVMVDLNCETDFVAMTDDFKTLARDIAMHVAASNPAYVSRDDVPADIVEKEKEIFRSQVTGKPENVIDRIIEGKLEKFFSENCLLEQIFVKDPDQKKKVGDLVTDTVGKIGENIVVRRFARFEVGEGQK